MTVRRVLVMPGDAVLGAQALEERKIVLPVLSAILARRWC
jgi:hypothetical protein